MYVMEREEFRVIGDKIIEAPDELTSLGKLTLAEELEKRYSDLAGLSTEDTYVMECDSTGLVINVYCTGE
jgi:hypothetical protein